MLISQSFLTLASQPLSATTLSSQSGYKDAASANHLHNQAEQGFPLYLLFSSFFPLFMPPPPPCLFLINLFISTVTTWLSSSYALFPFPLKLYTSLYTNPPNHLSAFQFCGLSPILSIGSPVISNSQSHCNLELEGFHSQLWNQAQAGCIELLVAASELQSIFANSGFITYITQQLRGPQH